MITVLGLIFLKGFREAIGIAVFLVSLYLTLNLITVAVALHEVFTHPELLKNWGNAVRNYREADGNWLLIIAIALIYFPKLALGLSGFETGVAVMPLVKTPDRVRNTQKLLGTAALIMSFMLICSSLSTTVLIEPKEFCPRIDCKRTSAEDYPPYCACSPEEVKAGTVKEAGKANGRALAYIAHMYLGDIFGTIYDISTILILWFAGASAMAGLLNIVPRYLPKYGMAPEWARATRPLTIVFTIICFAVTIWFEASVDAQGGAYATGVLVMISSASVAVTISSWRQQSRRRWVFLLITIVFAYTTIANIFERPDGIKIASFFIFSIILSSFISRTLRSLEVRIDEVELDEKALEFIQDLAENDIRIVANRRETGDVSEYRYKEYEKRVDNHIPSSDPIIFYEVDVGDASEFKGKIKVHGVEVDGYRILRTVAPSVPNAIAALLLYLRDSTGKIPHVYFGWSEGNPIVYLLRFVLFGEGDTAPVTREILRQAEPDPDRRPNVHVGG